LELGFFYETQITILFADCSGILGQLASAQNEPSGGMMRYPDVSEEHIVFVYANDLWIVDREGGTAMPLASPAGSERFPRFSPDGKSIAFSGNYEGDTDIYVVPTAGGVAERWTYHPANETVCDWTPDGKSVLYSSNGMAGLGRISQLFTISLDEPLPKQLPVPYGTNGAISEDKKWIAYTPHSRDGRTWKRYRGGMASDIWLYQLKNDESKKITEFEGTDSLPMCLLPFRWRRRSSLEYLEVRHDIGRAHSGYRL
jgi:tricorn protease